MVGGGDLFYLKFWASRPPLKRNRSKRGSKTQNGRFPSKIALRLKKVCYKVSLCENRQRQSCRTFIALTIHAKITGGDLPFYLKFWVQLTALERNRRFSIYFRPWRLSRNIQRKKFSYRMTNNMKSHTGFQLVPTSVTLNDLKRRNSPYFVFFAESDCFTGQLRHSAMLRFVRQSVRLSVSCSQALKRRVLGIMVINSNHNGYYLSTFCHNHRYHLIIRKDLTRHFIFSAHLSTINCHRRRPIVLPTDVFFVCFVFE